MNSAAHPAWRMPVRRDRQFSLVSKLIVWTAVVLMVVPPGLDYQNVVLDDGGNTATRALLIFLLSGSLLVLLARLRVALNVLKKLNPYFLGFLALAVLSLLWSIDSALTARRLFRLLVLAGVFTTIALAAWERERFQRVLRPVVTALLLGSLVFGLARPDLAIHQETAPELVNAWHGLTTQKNILGALAALGLILWVHTALARSVALFVALPGIGIALACLLLSRSATSLMSGIFGCCTMALLMHTPGSLRRTMPYLVTGLSMTMLLYALAILRVVPGLEILLSPIPVITGKDLSFTGRSDIWAAVVEHIQLRPLAGSGYGSYWGGPYPGTESYAIKAALRGFYPWSAHNGYLDVINDLGAIGFTLLIAYLLRYITDALRLYRTDRMQAALFIGLFMQQIIGNLSESAWFNVTNLEFVITAMATTCLARALVHQRQAAHDFQPGLGNSGA